MPALTPSNPTTALVNLTLDAVALCNQGANSRAHILLTKRKENKNMTFEEFMKALNPEQATLVTEHIAGIELAKDKTISELNEKVSTLTSDMDTLQKAKTVEAQPEDIMKDVSPAVKAFIDKLQADANAFVALQQETIAKERYEKVKALPVPEADLKEVLKSASPAVLSILEKAATAIAAGLAPVGKTTDPEFHGDSADDFYSILEKSAEAIAKAESITKEKAFTIACERDPETYAKYAKGVK